MNSNMHKVVEHIRRSNNKMNIKAATNTKKKQNIIEQIRAPKYYSYKHIYINFIVVR